MSRPAAIPRFPSVVGVLVMPVLVLLAGAGAIAYVVVHAHLSLISAETTPPLVGAALAGLLGAGGLIVTCKALLCYRREVRTLVDTQTALEELAAAVSVPPGTNPGPPVGIGLTEQVRQTLGRDDVVCCTPLLALRLTALLRAIDRGAPLLETDYARSEEQHFPGAERTLRAFMDIALNVGIAGTFLSLLLTFAQRGPDTSFTADKLLTNLGPGLISGMAGVFCNVSLRLAHAALVASQDVLARHVDDLLADHFVHRLPKGMTSAEVRLATTIETLLRETLDDLNNKVERIACSAEQLDRHSGSWGEVARCMAEDQKRMVSDLEQERRDNTTRANQVLEGFLNALDGFKKQTEMHHQEMKEWAEALLEDEQERRLAQNAELVQAALAKYNEAAGAYLAGVGLHVGELMAGSKEAFADAVRDSLAAALSDSTALVDEMRVEAASLAARLDQLGQAVERIVSSQRVAAERWSERDQQGQARFERLLTEGQEAQVQLNVAWQRSADKSLGNIASALDDAANGARTGADAVARELSGLHDRVAAVSEPLRAVAQALAGPVGSLAESQRTLAQALADATDSLAAFDNTLGTAAKAVEDTFQGASERMKDATKAVIALNDPLTRALDKVQRLADAVTALNGRVTQMGAETEEGLRLRERASNQAARSAGVALDLINEAAAGLVTQFRATGEAMREHGDRLVSYSPGSTTSARSARPARLKKPATTVEASQGELRPLQPAVGSEPEPQ